jgi:hypothetical protein
VVARCVYLVFPALLAWHKTDSVCFSACRVFELGDGDAIVLRMLRENGEYLITEAPVLGAPPSAGTAAATAAATAPLAIASVPAAGARLLFSAAAPAPALPLPLAAGSAGAGAGAGIGGGGNLVLADLDLESSNAHSATLDQMQRDRVMLTLQPRAGGFAVGTCQLAAPCSEMRLICSHAHSLLISLCSVWLCRSRR